MDEADVLTEWLEREDDIELTRDAIDLLPFSSPKDFMQSVRDHDAVVHLISLPFLQSLNCMRELLNFMKDDTDRNHYRQRTVPIIIENADDDINLFEATGQLKLVDFWMAKKSELEDEIDYRSKEFGPAVDALREDLTVLRDIAENIMRFMRAVTDNIFAVSYEDQRERSFVDVIQRLNEIGLESQKRSAELAGSATGGIASAPVYSRFPRSLSRLDGRGPGPITPSPAEASELSPEIERLIALRDSIVVPSESDPERPEFPPFSPRFPATPAERFHIRQLDREIIVKDESRNSTGSHKDRMAWEIVVYYREIIQDLLEPHSKTFTLPAASIISNGSAAVAIQLMLRCYGLPALKVLIDHRTSEEIVKKLRSVGCEVFKADLSEEELDSEDVLRLTENTEGFDVTARNLVDPTRRKYYDWLAYEILNCGAKHIFIPVGTGDLFVNVLNVLRDELNGVANDRRLAGGAELIEGLELYGATSNDWKTKMYKLYARHRPTVAEVHRVVEEMRDAGFCGEHTRVYDVNERIVPSAMSIARNHKIKCDESGIAGLSLLLQMRSELEIPDGEQILVVNTGWLFLG